jgi:preprotein translocase subunit SecD
VAPPDPGALPVPLDQAAAAYASLGCDATVAQEDVFRPEDHVAACSEDGAIKYLLGPAVLDGDQVTDAVATTDETTGAWTVVISFDSAGRAT